MYWFYFDNLLLPVTPGKVEVKINNRNTTLDLVSGGQINILKSPGLSEISFDILLPSVKYPFAMYKDGFKSPNYYLEKFEMLKKNRLAFNFIIIRTLSAEELLKYSAQLSSLPYNVLRSYDFNGDGEITAADARILLRNQGKMTILNDTNIKCAVEDYTVTEDAEKHGRDFYVSMKLKQCVDYGLKTAEYNVIK